METRPRLIYATTAVIAVAWVVLDQATKMVAVRTWSVQPPRDLGPVILRLIYNEGGAFSLPIRLPIIFVAVTVVVVTLVVRALPQTRSLPLAAAYGLVVGGAVGNGLDRIFRDGAVVDMIDLDFPPLQSFPVFNIADVGITVGAALVAILMILHERKAAAGPGPAVLDDAEHTVDPEAGAAAPDEVADADMGRTDEGEDRGVEAEDAPLLPVIGGDAEDPANG